MEYEVESIIGFSIINNTPYVQVKWKGFAETTTEPFKNFNNCIEAVEQFLHRVDQHVHELFSVNTLHLYHVTLPKPTYIRKAMSVTDPVLIKHLGLEYVCVYTKQLVKFCVKKYEKEDKIAASSATMEHIGLFPLYVQVNNIFSPETSKPDYLVKPIKTLCEQLSRGILLPTLDIVLSLQVIGECARNKILANLLKKINEEKKLGLTIYSQVAGENNSYSKFGDTEVGLCVYKVSHTILRVFVIIAEDEPAEPFDSFIKDGVHTKTMVKEVRMDPKTKKQAQAFAGMLNSGASMLIETLKGGTLVKFVTVYGIIPTLQYRMAETLKLHIDFENNTSASWVSHDEIPLEEALSMGIMTISN